MLNDILLASLSPKSCGCLLAVTKWRFGMRGDAYDINAVFIVAFASAVLLYNWIESGIDRVPTIWITSWRPLANYCRTSRVLIRLSALYVTNLIFGLDIRTVFSLQIYFAFCVMTHDSWRLLLIALLAQLTLFCGLLKHHWAWVRIVVFGESV